MALKMSLHWIQSISGHLCHKSYYHLALVVYYSCRFHSMQISQSGTTGISVNLARDRATDKINCSKHLKSNY